MRAYLDILRPHQWIKNGFLFLPLFFGKKLGDPEGLCATSILFIAFSLIAGSVYILNDLLDAERDRDHPRKKNRPIAAGRISYGNAIVWCGIVLLLGWTVLFVFLPDPRIWGLVLLYLCMNTTYSFVLKHVALLDLMIVAAGFVIRIFLGGITGDVAVSEWIVIMTFLLAIFLATAKRRHSLLLQKEEDAPPGLVELYNTLLNISAAVLIIAYLVYTLMPLTQERFGEHVYLSGVFVLLGVFRYLQSIYMDTGADTGSPTLVFLHDWYLQIIIVSWFATFCFLAYR